MTQIQSHIRPQFRYRIPNAAYDMNTAQTLSVDTYPPPKPNLLRQKPQTPSRV